MIYIHRSKWKYSFSQKLQSFKMVRDAPNVPQQYIPKKQVLWLWASGVLALREWNLRKRTLIDCKKAK